MIGWYVIISQSLPSFLLKGFSSKPFNVSNTDPRCIFEGIFYGWFWMRMIFTVMLIVVGYGPTINALLASCRLQRSSLGNLAVWSVLLSYLVQNLDTGKYLLTSSNGEIFCVTGPLCREITGHRLIPCTKASDAELWWFLWSSPEQAIGLTIETQVIWNDIVLIVTPL